MAAKASRRVRSDRPGEIRPGPGAAAVADAACGPVPKASGPLGSRPGTRFVVHRHAASRLHWDLRLEMEGVARSWAVPKEPPEAKGVRRLAIMQPDHAVEYMGFEGVIPEGEYGAGEVEIWDGGRYALEERGKGKLVVRLEGQKLRGRYLLVNTAGKQWLFFKTGE